MIESFLTVARQVGVLALLMGVGYVCKRKRVLDESAVKGIVDLLLYIVAPCLIVTAFQRPFARADAEAALVTAAMAFAIQFAGWGISLAIRDKANLATQGVLRFAVVFSNAGFMGLPLDQALLGTDGVFYGSIYIAVFNLTSWTLGLAIMCGDLSCLEMKQLVRNPGLIGIALGLPLFLTSTTLPEPVHSAVASMGELNTPLAMIVIGYYLAQSRARRFTFAGCRMQVALAYFLRLAGVSIAVVPVLYVLCRRWPVPCVAMSIVTAAPVAAVTAMFAAKFGKDVESAASIVAGTTVVSIFTMPFIVGFSLWLFGV
ncbi:MAG: AEC family transporter [Kiritimatiellae bacterium]|nr:AEC family transporter [Kiritimatiellia bacterium]